MAVSEPKGALDGIVVLDLTRILAGPTATQMLGDLGATVWKIENPKTGGDDTRSWGPPFATDASGKPTDLSAYFISSNRNKLSVSVDIATPQGQETLRKMAARADVVIQNFKPGGLAKYGMDYETLLKAHPQLVYCSISGFGQTGPNRGKPGYDLMAQGFGGVMSFTGDADGSPMKVGVGVADLMCGMYATIGILAALRHRDQTGEGQHIDLALVDTQMAWLANQGTNYLVSGESPKRLGNAHPNIVPYDVFEVADGHMILAVGNDAQFARFCDFIKKPEWAEDPRFKTNPARLEHRTALLDLLKPVLLGLPRDTVIEGLEALRVPAGPINTVEQALTSEQAQARGAVVNMSLDPAAPDLRVLGNPLKFSATPVCYNCPPPQFGQDTETVLESLKTDANCGETNAK